MLESHRIALLVMALRSEAVRIRMNRAASPHHRMIFDTSRTATYGPGGSLDRADDRHAFRARWCVGRATLGGSSPRRPATAPKRSGDAVRTRVNSEVSPLPAWTVITRCVKR